MRTAGPASVANHARWPATLRRPGVTEATQRERQVGRFDAATTPPRSPPPPTPTSPKRLSGPSTAHTARRRRRVPDLSSPERSDVVLDPLGARARRAPTPTRRPNVDGDTLAQHHRLRPRRTR